MRFFSNEAKDNDEREAESRDEHTPAEPAVPQQRAGSPWHNPRTDSEPATKPVAVGSSTVTGPTTPAAPASGHDDDPDRTSPIPGAGDRTAAFEDGTTAKPASGNPDDVTDHPAGHSGQTPVAWPAGSAPARNDDPHLTQPIPGGTGTPRDTADRDHDGIADIDEGRTATSRSTDHDHLSSSGKTDSLSDSAKGDPVGDTAKADAVGDTKAHSVSDAAKADAFGGAAEAGAETDRTASDKAGDEADRTPAEKAADKGQEPLVPPASESTISGPAPFFPSADTQPLRDRWRDVQLRFVDDPKKATAEAAGLVDEAVDKLSKALRDQRGALAKGTDDTESLRVELRSYRDILDRLLGL